MDCVNHSGTPATAYCQNCGKALCDNCARKGVTLGAATQVFCEQCLAAWQHTVQSAQAFDASVSSAPNPVAAGILGIIPGVGAMYNGQFFKGLVHVIIFVVLVSLTDHYDVFGFFIAAWILYQAFEAYHTARARRDGQPLPDPLGLNEVGNWFNMSWHSRNPADEWAKQQTGAQSNPQSGPAAPNPGVNPNPYAPPAAGAYRAPYRQAPYTQPGANPYTQAGPTNPGASPAPPVPPPYWRRREPVGAIVLIALGLIFLFNQLGYVTERIIDYGWPLILIALGAWMIVRRVGDNKGGSR